jgi:hypothetical protein
MAPVPAGLRSLEHVRGDHRPAGARAPVGGPSSGPSTTTGWSCSSTCRIPATARTS